MFASVVSSGVEWRKEEKKVEDECFLYAEQKTTSADGGERRWSDMLGNDLHLRLCG